MIDQTGGNLSIGGNAFTNSGTIDVANGGSRPSHPTTFTTTASSLITIEANSSVAIEAETTTLNGAVSGAGTLAIAGGSATIESGASASVANLSESGAERS